MRLPGPSTLLNVNPSQSGRGSNAHLQWPPGLQTTSTPPPHTLLTVIQRLRPPLRLSTAAGTRSQPPGTTATAATTAHGSSNGQVDASSASLPLSSTARPSAYAALGREGLELLAAAKMRCGGCGAKVRSWTGGWTGGWSDGRSDGQTDRRSDRLSNCLNRQITRQAIGQTVRHSEDCQTGRQKGSQGLSGCRHVCRNQLTNSPCCYVQVGSGVLSRVLSRLQQHPSTTSSFPDSATSFTSTSTPLSPSSIVVGLDSPDDAALVRPPPPGYLLVQTVDFFRSFWQDAYVFGKVAANHALGDCFAMGGGWGLGVWGEGGGWGRGGGKEVGGRGGAMRGKG